MKKHLKSKEVEPSSTWVCETCKQVESCSHGEMMKHLREAHGIETKGLKANRSMRMHMDGDTWFAYQWEWRVPQEGKEDIVMMNHTIQPRAKDDMMRWMGGE